MKTYIFVASVLLLSANAFAQTPSAPPGATPPVASEPGPLPPSSTPVPAPVQPPPFEALDANADGRITSTEAQANRALSAKFAMIDKQGKGYISKDEYQIFVQGERRGS